MAENKSIELRYYAQAPADGTVYLAVWQFNKKGMSEPVEGTVAAAGFHIIDGDGRPVRTLKLGAGLSWNDTDKKLVVRITNNELRFIREDTELTYECWVQWANGETETIREGTVTAVRVG